MIKRLLFILPAFLLFSVFLVAQNPLLYPKVTRAGKGIVNTKIDNIGYWKKMIRLGYVQTPPKIAAKKAVFTTSRIMLDGRFVQDSPDVPITTLTNTTQSENSVFVSPEDEGIVLNSNNSTDTSSAGSGLTLYGTDDFYTEDAGLSWAGSIAGTGEKNSGDPATAIGLNGWWYVGMINNSFGQSLAYSTDQGSTWNTVVVSPGPGGNNILDKNHLWIDNQVSSPFQGYLYDAWTSGVSGSPNENNIELSRSADHGLTWTTPLNISAAVNAGAFNHGVNINSGPNGEVYVAWAIYDSWPADESAIGFAKSIDGGAIFAPAKRIITNIMGIRNSGTSKMMRVNSFPSMTVDVSGGLYGGNIYVVWANIGVPGVNSGKDIDIYMLRSEDGGETWSSPIRVNQDPAGHGKQHFFPWITCDPENGNLCVIYYDDRETDSVSCEAWVSWSNDGGNTWSDMKVSDVAFTPSPIPGLTFGYFGDYLGITSRNMKVYPAWTDNRTGTALTYVSPIDLGPPPGQPYIVYDSYSLTSMSGEPLPTLNYGDSLRLSLGLKNIGDRPVSGLTVFLSSPSPYIRIADSVESYAHFDPGEIKTIADGFSFAVSDSIPDGLKVRFDIRSTDGDSTWYSHFGIEAHAPSPVIQGYVIEDTLYGNGNGRPDPGEQVVIDLSVRNKGDFPCYRSFARLFTSYRFLDLISDSVYLDTILPGEGKHALFPVVVSEEASPGTAFNLGFSVTSGLYHRDASFPGMIGTIAEDWESNSFTKFPWTFGGDKNWTITSLKPWEGDYCAVSGVIHNLESSELKLVYESSVDDSISFFRKVSCEQEWDYLAFYIDSVFQDYWSGDVAWGRAAFAVPAGTHTFKWVYSKDIDVSSGFDRAWLDLIEFPPPLLPSVDPGPDDSICAGQKYQLKATVSGYDSLRWYTDGDGVFSDPAIVDPVYTPGSSDIQDGSVRLKIVAYGKNGFTPGFMYLTLNGVPEVGITADPGDSICSWQTVTLHSNAMNYDSIHWTPGNFTTADITADLALVGSPGAYWFRVTAMNSSGCRSVDSALIVFKYCLGLEEPAVAFTSEIYPNPNNGIFTVSVRSRTKENIVIRIVNSLNVAVYTESHWLVSGRTARVFDLHDLPAGVYFLELERKTGNQMFKFLIRK